MRSINFLQPQQEAFTTAVNSGTPCLPISDNAGEIWRFSSPLTPLSLSSKMLSLHNAMQSPPDKPFAQEMVVGAFHINIGQSLGWVGSFHILMHITPMYMWTDYAHLPCICQLFRHTFRYYSMYGHVEKLGEEIRKGVEGVEAKVFSKLLPNQQPADEHEQISSLSPALEQGLRIK